MKISDIINTNSILLNLRVSNKRQLLQELADKASKISGIDSRTIFDTVLERENLGSTGFGDSTALPHARIAETEKVFGIFAKLAQPIDFEAVDSKPVDLIFMLISPENSGADHLTALAQVSRLLKDETACTNLRQAKDAEEAFSIML